MAGRIAGSLALALLVTGVLVLRRPDQLLDPYIWIEEVLTIPQILHHGVLALFDPVQGYIILPSKVIALAATYLSFFHYPELSYAFTLLVSAATALCVALSPTLLRWRWACGLLVFLIPTGVEVFAIAHMTFWLTSLLAFLVLLWRPDAEGADAGRPWLRGGFMLVAGLSSPLVIGLLPLFALRAWWTRRRDDLGMLLLGVATGAVQLVLMWPGLGGGMEPVTPAGLADLVLRRLFGSFVVRVFELPPPWHAAAGAALALLLSGAALAALRRKDWVLPCLGVCLAVTMALSVARAPIDVIAPEAPAPRYFFFPYVLLMWMAVQVAARETRLLRASGIAVLVLALANLKGVFTVRHEPLDWRSAVAACAAGDTHPIPLHVYGSRADLWWLKLTPAECRDLLGRGLFGPPAAATLSLAAALGRWPLDTLPARLGPALEVAATAEGWGPGGVPPVVAVPPVVSRTYGSFFPSDGSTGTLTLGPLRAPGGVIALPVVVSPRSDRQSLSVIRRSGAGETVQTIDLGILQPHRWYFLRLYVGDDAVTIRAVDGGDGWGEWFAVGAPMAVAAGG